MKKLILMTFALTLVLAPAALAADGAALFKGKCAMCHGADGAGQTSMGKNLKLRALGSAEVQKQSDADLTKITTDGKGKMPAYKAKMNEAEIKAVVAHIRSLKK